MRAGQALEAVALEKRYGSNRAVFSGLNFALQPGTVTTLAGGNGSGKSTLLRIVAGVVTPTSGRIVRSGGEVAVVPERFVAPGSLSAAGYLTQLARIRPRHAEAIRERSLALLDRLALEPGASVPLRLLSKGNAQKVAIAQAFAAEAALLVLDEPRAGLDVRANDVLDQLIEEARRHGSIVLLSGHEDRQPKVVDQAFSLAAGALSTAEPAPQRVAQRLIRLAPTESSRPLAGLPSGDTLPSGEAGLEVCLTVADAEADLVLRIALDSGWSVREVSEAREGTTS